MRSILVVTATAEKAGAETIIYSLLEGLSRQFRFHLGVVRRKSVARSQWGFPVVGLWGIFFGQYDLIHTHLFLPGVLVRIRRFWDRDFVWVHTVHYASYQDHKWKRIRAFLDRQVVFPACDRLTAVSSTVVEFLQPDFNSELIENAIPWFNQSVEDPHASINQLTIGTVAMLRPEKGLDDILDVVEQMRTAFPNMIWKIAGDGPERDKLRKKIKARGLGSHVKLAGYVRDTENFYRSLDVYVQPSKSEAFGIAVVEAMRAGIPVITSSAGHLPKLLKNGEFGAIVVRDNWFVDNLHQTISRVVNNIDEYARKSRQGSSYWAKSLNEERMRASYAETYRELLPL